jgi:hypothetical protein
LTLNFIDHKEDDSNTWETGSNQTTFLGIHLSGPNCPKTAAVFLRLTPKGYLSLDQVYEKIGPKGNLFSDDRLMQILQNYSKISAIIVDQPLSMPPCVACQRPQCPGVVGCDDLVVASMMKIAGHLQKVAPSKNRVINPQTQRLWDVMQLEKNKTQSQEHWEPTYQGHLAPLVTRALVLKKRISTFLPSVPFLETSVKIALMEAFSLLELDKNYLKAYKNFEIGHDVRKKVIEKILGSSLLNAAALGPKQSLAYASVIESVECFQAFICAWVGVLQAQGFVPLRPEFFPASEGWVYLPVLEHEKSSSK